MNAQKYPDLRSATDYHEQKNAKVHWHNFLIEKGWECWGFKEDKSDSMTDYFDPACWDGIAAKGDLVLCIDVSDWQASRDSGQVPTTSKRVPIGNCIRCKGTGHDPSGWTLEQAKANPVAFNTDPVLHDDGTRAGLPNVVSPLQFGDDGIIKCRKCHGSGKVYRTEEVAHPDDQWPKFQANPPRCNWHVEKAGKIVNQGTGAFSAYSSNHHNEKIKAQMLAKMEELYNRMMKGTTERQPAEPVQGVTVRPGTREGYSEVVFPAKPAEDVRDALKAAGYRWSRANGVWFGKTANLPDCFK